MLTQRATILSEAFGAEDRYHDATKSWTDVAGHTWACRIDPTSSQESEVDRDTRKSWFRIFLTEKAQGFIDSQSRIEVDGELYEVFGDVEVYRKRAITDHLEAILRTIDGGAPGG